MTKQLFSGNLNIYYGQFYIDVLDFDDESYLDMDSAFDDQQNGLCGARHPGKLFFMVGPQDGTARLRVELHDSEPHLLEDYQDIVECPFDASARELHLCEWAFEAMHPLDLPSGEYVVRYSIKNIDHDYGEECDWEQPVEGQEYLVQFWPGSALDDKIVRNVSELGHYWHQELGALQTC